MTVEVHDDHFAADTPDEEWLAEVGSRGWAVLSKDEHIRKRPLELQAAATAKVALFVLVSKGLTADQMASIFEAGLGRMQTVHSTTAKPFICLVYRDGTIKRYRVIARTRKYILKAI